MNKSENKKEELIYYCFVRSYYVFAIYDNKINKKNPAFVESRELDLLFRTRTRHSLTLKILIDEGIL